MMLVELCICDTVYFPIFSGSYTHPSICHTGVIEGLKLKVEVRMC
jgi:hypothetical protein